MQVRNLVEGRWNLAVPPAPKRPPWGLWGGKPGDRGGYLLKRPGENKFTHEGWPISRRIGAK